jgi:S1-C subfamily serine protease
MPSDRVETLNLSGMVKVVDLVTDGVAELGTSTGRPEYLKVTTPYPRTTALWSVTSSFGVIPNAIDSKGGVLVDEVFANTPAAIAGLKAGDRIVAVGGQAAEDLQTYLHVIRALPVGEPVEVFVIREGRPKKFSVQLTKINVAQAATQFGIAIDPKDKAALRVTAVTPESTAARAGLRAGDRIVELAGKSATGGVDAMRHLLGFTTGDSVELAFERDGKIQKAKVPLTFDVTAVLGRPARGPRGG